MKLYKIISLLCLMSIFNACKKELSDEFDPIIGKWKWYRTVKNQKDIFTGSVVYTEPYAWSSSSTDQYEIEFRKKGLVIMYKNGNIENKYKVKSSNGSFQNFSGGFWNYEIKFKKDELLGVQYFPDMDTLVLRHFPYTTSTNNDFSYSNHFIRE